MADGKPEVQLLLFIVNQKYREDLVRYYTVCEFRDFLQQFVEVENRCDFVIDLDQCRDESPGLGTDDGSGGIGLHLYFLLAHFRLASSRILMPELVPSRDAPAWSITRASA